MSATIQPSAPTPALLANFRSLPDPDHATVLSILMSRPDLHDAALSIAAHAIVSQLHNTERRQIVAQAARQASIGDSPHMARLQARVSFYDYLLPHAPIRLGDATADDLDGAVAYHRARAEDEAGKAAMFERIRAAMGRKRGTVRAVLDENKLAEAMNNG